MSKKPDRRSRQPDTTPAKPAPQTGEGNDHDDAEQAGPSPLASALEVAREVATRYRVQALPLPLIAATHAAAVIGVHLLDGWAKLAPVGAVGLLGTAVYALGRKRATPAGRAGAKTAVWAATGWAALATLTGLAGWTVWGLWVGGWAMAVPYWMRHTDPDPDTEAEQAAPPPAPPPAPEPDKPAWQTLRWAKYLAKSNGGLPGSKYAGITDVAYGFSGTVDLGRGHHHSELFTKLPIVNSVFDLPDGSAVPEVLPNAPVHHLRLTVLTENPLQQVHSWPGPQLDPATGLIPVMVTADGAVQHWRLWQPGNGAMNGLLSGTKGSGKSSLLNILLSEVTASDRMFPVVIDGNGGMSIPDWTDQAPYKAVTPDETLNLLAWVEQVRQARSRELATLKWTDEHGRARTGVPKVEPTPNMPGIVVFIDEAQLLLDGSTHHGPRILNLVKTLTQMGRKTMISVVLVTQQPTILELGGKNAGVLRNMLKSDNVVSFRTAEKSASGMVANTPPPEPLHTLPSLWPDGQPTAGLGYMLSGRLIRSRAYLHDDPYAYAELLPRKQLDPLAASVPMPQPAVTPPTAGQAAGRAPHSRPNPSLHVATSDGHDVADMVRDALDNGCPHDVGALMQHTGLSLFSVRAALKQLEF